MNFDRPIVIDTGVLISAAIRPQSVPALALERALRYYEVCASSATLDELLLPPAAFLVGHAQT